RSGVAVGMTVEDGVLDLAGVQAARLRAGYDLDTLGHLDRPGLPDRVETVDLPAGVVLAVWPIAIGPGAGQLAEEDVGPVGADTGVVGTAPFVEGETLQARGVSGIDLARQHQPEAHRRPGHDVGTILFRAVVDAQLQIRVGIGQSRRRWKRRTAVAAIRQ